jgi:DNA processing protein
VQQEWLVALRAPGLGARQLRALFEAFGSIEAVLAASSAQLQAAGLKPEVAKALRHPDQALLEQDQAWLAGAGHHLVTIDQDQYPALLAAIPGAPPALWVVGDPDLLWRPQIAIVGSRNPSAAGLEHARDFAAELAGLGFTVTSGLAAGIDVAAHRAALDTPGASTVAVLGTGPDRLYPARNAEVGRRIAREGALVTELLPGTPAKRSHFPSRNRIISGLSLGVLVVEAGLHSGSLITARMAGDQGREVFALPGSLHNPMARGCHRLIKQGARLVECTDDIVSELAPLAGELSRALQALPAQTGTPASAGPKAVPSRLDDPEYQRLWANLGHDPVPVDAVIQRSGLEARAVSSMLLMLELEGRVVLHPGGRISRASGST